MVHVYPLMKLRHAHIQQLTNLNHKKKMCRKLNLKCRSEKQLCQYCEIDISILLGSGRGMLSEHKTVACSDGR